MRRALTIVGAALLFAIRCDAGFAQVSTTPGMGATSPLGSLLSNAPSQANAIPLGGIPLGATELNSGGLSPTVGTAPCSSTAPTSPGTSGSSSNFDGGGSMSYATISTSCASGSSAPGAAASPAAGSPITGLTPGSAGAGVPLGSTELGTPGESPAMLLPVPSISGVPCPGISPMTGTLGTSSTSTASTNGC